MSQFARIYIYIYVLHYDKEFLKKIKKETSDKINKDTNTNTQEQRNCIYKTVKKNDTNRVDINNIKNKLMLNIKCNNGRMRT